MSQTKSNTSFFEDVQLFHRQILGAEATAPNLLSTKSATERINFLEEELKEFRDAIRCSNLIKTADALADLVYVALGTADMMGLPFNEIWAAVQKANMSKVRGITKRGNEIDACKPEGWVGPESNIASAIARHAAEFGRNNDRSSFSFVRTGDLPKA